MLSSKSTFWLSSIHKLAFGIATDQYDVDSAIRAAKFLYTKGINTQAKNYKGETLVDYIKRQSDDIQRRAAPLVEELNKLAVFQG